MARSTQTTRLHRLHITLNFLRDLWSRRQDQNWKDGFLRFIELGNEISEKDLLDGDRYLWRKEYSLAFILVASYDHHQEHIEKLIDWLREHRS